LCSSYIAIQNENEDARNAAPQRINVKIFFWRLVENVLCQERCLCESWWKRFCQEIS